MTNDMHALTNIDNIKRITSLVIKFTEIKRPDNKFKSWGTIHGLLTSKYVILEPLLKDQYINFSWYHQHSLMSVS